MCIHQETILNVLTPDDIRILIEFVGEDSRRGNFERIFPTANSRKYQRYFEQRRYYNMLLDAWCRKFAHAELQGLYDVCTVYILHLSYQATSAAAIQHLPKGSDHGERERVTRVRRWSPQRVPGAEPVVGAMGEPGSPIAPPPEPLKLKAFLSIFIVKCGQS